MFEVNKGSPTKYIMIKKGNDALSLQQKIFRKAFYENGSMFTDSVVFAEISNARIAKKVGIESDDQIVVCQNKNEFSSLPHSFKVLNLEIERTQPIEDLLNSTISSKF